MDTAPLIKQRLQEKVIRLRDYFKKNNIKYQKLKHNNKKIIISLNEPEIKKLKNIF